MPYPPPHLIQDFGIGLGQLHGHGVRSAGEFEGVRVLAVLPLIQGRSRCFGIFHLHGTDGNPANSLHSSLIVQFIVILESNIEEKGEMQNNRPDQNIYLNYVLK